MAQSDNEPAKPAEVSDHRHLASALVALEAAAAVLRTRAEAAEKRADAAEVDRQVAQTRADQAVAERDEANRRAAALQVWLDAAQLELAGRRALADLTLDAQDAVVDRKGRGRWARLRAAWRGE